MRKIYLFLASVFFTSSLMSVYHPIDLDEYKYMDSCGLTTDKSSIGHNYTQIYSQYFSPLKDKPLKFLEIGIWHGGGVKFWENYFKNAELHFVDIQFETVNYFSKRSHYHLADQSKAAELNALINKIGSGFDIIIDDGGHTMDQQLVSFTTLFPHVNRGGMYIIEDLCTSYWESYGGGGTMQTPATKEGSFINYLKHLVDELNYVSARTGNASHFAIPDQVKAELNIYREQIYSMHFYDCMCVIIKR